MLVNSCKMVEKLTGSFARVNGEYNNEGIYNNNLQVIFETIRERDLRGKSYS